MTKETEKQSRDSTIPVSRLRWGIQLTIVLAALWLALNGLSGWLLGLLVSLAGGVAGAWLVPAHPYPWRPHRLLGFALFFVRASLAGGVDVAWRAMHPRLPIEPTWLEYPLSLPPGQPRTLMISVVSLLPGTLSADLKDDQLLVVHGISGSPRQSVEALEKRISWLFSLDSDRESR